MIPQSLRPNPVFSRTTRTRALGLGLAGIAAVAMAMPMLARADADLTPASTPLRCAVALDAVSGGTEITGTVTSNARPVAGQYDMTITSRASGGSATIRQSGPFEARPGAPAILGQTRMSGSPSNQTVALTVTIEGRRLPCAAAL